MAIPHPSFRAIAFSALILLVSSSGVWAGYFSRIVIDPGHGGKDPGAIGPNGTRESNVVLPISIKLADYFNKTTDMQAILTRNDNTFIPLRERMEIARKYNADLFLSPLTNVDALLKAV